jgi:autotransporter-associated beta strand protein
MGGAIFVMQGGSLTIGGILTINGNTVTAGVAGGGGATAGSAFGSGLFMQGSGTITFQPGAGQVQTIANTIADEAGVVAGGYSPPAGFGTPGSWSLTKDGGGTLILSGVNSYSGGTNFNAGIVSVSADNNLGANTGALTFNGGTLQFGASFDLSNTRAITLNGGGGTIDTNGFSTTISQAIAGAGSLTKSGLGTLTLSGANAYFGGTIVNAGTLQISGAGTLGDIGSATTINGGTLNLGGTTQTQNGGLTLTGGTLQNGTLSSSGTFDMQAGTVSAALAGTGGVSKTTAGTVILSGINTYLGGTNLNAGIVNVSADNNLGAATGALTFNGGTLQFGASFNLANTRAITLNAGGGTFDTNGFDTTISQVIGGAGGLTKIGNGTLTLDGLNAYGGATNINGGVLTTFGQAIPTGSAVSIANAAILNMESDLTIGSLAGAGIARAGLASPVTLTTGGDNTSTTFSGTLMDNGVNQLSLVKAGAGTFTLSGPSTYTGTTTVNAGTLSVNGSIASSSGLTVNAGGTIGGNGILPSTTINGGTLAPGNSIGTLTIQGNLVLTAAAAYIVEVSPTQADRTNVTGTATLAGTVQAVFGPGSYVVRTYTILSAAGGRSGTFGSLTTSGLPAGFAASLSYTGTDAILNLTAVLGQQPTAPGQQPLPNGGLSQNQFNVASTLNNFFNNGGTLPPNFLNVFGLTGSNLTNALTLLSGEAATGAQQGAFKLMDQFLSLMLDPFVDGRSGVGGAGGPALGFAPDRPELPEEIALAYSKVMKTPVFKSAPITTFEQRWTAWGAGYGGYNKTSGDPAVVGSHDLIARTFGYAAGLDYHVSRDSVVGVALAGGGTNWSLAQGLGSGSSDAFQAGAYAATRSGPAYLAASLAFANHWMSTDRYAAFGDHLTADFKAQSFGGRVETGYRFGVPVAGVTPYAAIQAQSFRTPGYSEVDGSGGGFGLAYNSRTGTDTRSELGSRFDHVAAFNRDALLTLRARLAWAHDWVSNPALAAAFQALPGTGFIVNGATPAKDSALVSTGAELRLVNGVTLLAKFDGEFASHSSTYGGTGTFRYSW